jgi:hypothetical protein
MRTPPTAFRLTDDDRTALDLIASNWGIDNRTEVLRRLVYAELENGELAAKAGRELLDRLRADNNPSSQLAVTIDGPSVVEASINGQALNGALVDLVFGASGKADRGELTLRKGPAAVFLAELPPVAGEVTLTFDLDALTG